MNRIYGTPEDEALYFGEGASSLVVLVSSPLMEDFCSEEELRSWANQKISGGDMAKGYVA